VVFSGDGTFEVREFGVPSPPPRGAVLRVEAVGLCGSDVAQLNGIRHVPGEVSPVVPGHEIVGRLHAVAPDADLGATEGQRVAVDLVHRCGSCAACRSGSPLCQEMRLYGYTFPLDERSGLFGGYGEYMEILPGSHLLPLTDDLPAEELTLFEPLANACNWLERVAVGPDTTVVVEGPGHMGLVTAALARSLGAPVVIVTGTAKDALRLAAALAVGATHTVDIDAEDVRARVGELTDGRMADVVIDLTDGSGAVQGALDLVRFGGTVLLAGLKHFEPVKIVSDLIPLKALTVIGGAGSTPASMETSVGLLNAGKIPTRALLGEVFALDGIDDAMALLRRDDPSRDAVRVGLVHR